MTLASNLRDNKAVYTFAGAGDLAVEKLREVPEQVTRYQDEVRGNLDRYRGQVREQVDRYRGEVRENVGKLEVRDLPGAAVAYVTDFGSRTVGFVDELAERGKKVVHREETAEITEPKPKPRASAQRKGGAQSGSAAKKAQS